MSELTKKRVHWTEYNGDELLHDEDVDVLTSADAVTFDDGEDLQYKYTQGQFVNPSVTGSLSSLSTTNKSSLVDAINEVKTNATSNESSIGSLTERMSIAETDIDNLEDRMDTAESEIDSLKSSISTAESDIDSLELDVTSLGNRMSTAESDIGSLETRVTPITLGGTGATSASSARSMLGVTGTVLYNNTSGTSGTITLSDSAANYDYLVFYYAAYQNSSNCGTKIYNANGKTVGLSSFEGHYQNSGTGKDGVYGRVCDAIVSGTSVVLSAQMQVFWNYDTPDGYWDPLSGAIKIKRVEGWKI